MAASFTVQGQNIKIDFKYTAAAAVVTNVATYAANNLFLRGFKAANTPHGDWSQAAFDALSNQQKLDILDAYVVRQFTDLAKEFKISQDIATANAAAVAAAQAGLTINP